MKKIIILALYLVSTLSFTYAQNYNHEFGKYSNEEFQLKTYDKDPSAEAVIIYDIGESYFTRTDAGFQVYFKHKMKIKILTKAGIKNGQISIPYYIDGNQSESIEELGGHTYNYENGQVRTSTLDLKNTYNEKSNEHWFEKKFAMPDVKEGSVIEVYYKIRSPFLFNLRNWIFQHDIPIIYSEYTTSMIPFYEYTYIFQGASKFDNFKSSETQSSSSPFAGIEYKDMEYNFLMIDLPAFKDESFITSASDYLIKLDFQLAAIHFPTGGNSKIMTTWPELCNEMMDLNTFGKYMNNCKKKTADLLDTMQFPDKSSIEKAKKIERFVKTNFNWNGKSDKSATKSVKEFLTSKTGNCADINLFLAGMLNSAGIEAFPVIISTRDHGKIKLDYPFEHFFNYVIVMAKIDSSTVLMDATEPISNFKEIPARCINDKGLVIQRNKVEWVNLKSKSVSRSTYNFLIELTQGTDSLKQACCLTSTGYKAIDYRKKFITSYKDLKADLLGNDALQSDSLSPVNLNQTEHPFKIKFNKTIPVEAIEDKIIVFPFCNFPLSENPLKQPTRKYPIDLIYKKSYSFQASIKIPAGYQLITKPTDLRINDNLIKINYITDTQINGTINVQGNYEFKNDVYPFSDYI